MQLKHLALALAIDDMPRDAGVKSGGTSHCI